MGMLDELLGGLMQGGLTSGTGTQGMPGSAPGIPGLGAAGGGAAILAIILQLLQQGGGLQGMLGKMQQAGYGDQAQSWIGSGQNQAIPPDALSQIFGSGTLQQLAQQFGMSTDQLTGTVSQALPDVVSRMTPNGGLPAGGGDDLVSRTLQELMRGQR